MAFNVERRGVLKLMQGQRRSFEQLDRGQLGAAAQRSSDLWKRQRLQAPRSPALVVPLEGGVGLVLGRGEKREGCVISADSVLLISNRVTTRLLDGTPPRRGADIAPITALFASCPAETPSHTPFGVTERGQNVRPPSGAPRRDRLPTLESQCHGPAEPEPHGARARRWRRSGLWACIRP